MKPKAQKKRNGPNVFLSYANADKAAAEDIARQLRLAGLQVPFSEWNLKPGDSIVERAGIALSTSDLVIVLLSPHSISSNWVQNELTGALAKELSGRGAVVIPAIIEHCEIPAQLLSKQVWDLRAHFKFGLRRLIDGIEVAFTIDFSRLTPARFEELVADLLKALGFKIQKEKRLGARVADFEAHASFWGPFDTIQSEFWLVESKLYTDKRVSVSVLDQMIHLLASSPHYYKGLVITNGQLSSVAWKFLEEETSKTRTEIRVIDGEELRRLLILHPTVAKRHFWKEPNP